MSYSNIYLSVVSDSLPPHGLYSLWNSPGQSTGVGSLSVLQGIFPTQGFQWLRCKSGQTKLECVYEEANERYCDIDQQLYFLKQSPEFLLRTSRSGRWHVMLCKLDGTYVRHLTNGEWDVSAIKAIDEKKKLVYLETTKTNHLQRQLFKVGFDGEKLTRITVGPGTHSVTFNADASQFIDCHSTNQAPPVYALYSSDGKKLRVLEDNAKLKKLLKDYPVTKKEMFHFVTPEKTKLYGWIVTKLLRSDGYQPTLRPQHSVDTPPGCPGGS